MYHACYYRFGEVTTSYGRPAGYDLARNVRPPHSRNQRDAGDHALTAPLQVEIGNKDIKLEVLEEAFTSQNWIVRIYKVKQLPNWDGTTFNPITRGVDKYGRCVELRSNMRYEWNWKFWSVGAGGLRP
jgi:hypothetical protein